MGGCLRCSRSGAYLQSDSVFPVARTSRSFTPEGVGSAMDPVIAVILYMRIGLNFAILDFTRL